MAWSEELHDIRTELGGWLVPLVSVLIALLILLGWAIFGEAQAQTRYCADWSSRQVRGAEWPFSDCRNQRVRRRHAYRETYHYYRSDDRSRSAVRHYRSVEDDDDRSWNRRDVREERGVSCLPIRVRVVGPARLNEKSALEAAIRQWQSSVAYDHAEKFMDLSDARNYRWRCNRASSNESVIGKAGEAVFGDSAVQKKCAIIATPCLPPMKDGDKDEK